MLDGDRQEWCMLGRGDHCVWHMHRHMPKHVGVVFAVVMWLAMGAGLCIPGSCILLATSAMHGGCWSCKSHQMDLLPFPK
jgi:hypothetical protein